MTMIKTKDRSSLTDDPANESLINVAKFGHNSVNSEVSETKKKGIGNDFSVIVFLIYLYILQGKINLTL